MLGCTAFTRMFQSAYSMRRRLGQPAQAPFRRAVGGREMAVDAGGRADIDDRAAAAVAHDRRRRLDAEERPGEIDRQHAIPIGARGVGEIDAAQRNAGIVDQHMQRAECTLGERDGVAPILFAGDVEVAVVAPCRRPARSIAPARAPSASSTSPTTTRAPACANTRASAAPCPRLPPVMRTVLLANFGSTALCLPYWPAFGSNYQLARLSSDLVKQKGL